MNNNLHSSMNSTLKGSIKILVEKVNVDGNGVILLTGPSGCGKGEIAKVYANSYPYLIINICLWVKY